MRFSYIIRFKLIIVIILTSTPVVWAQKTIVPFVVNKAPLAAHLNAMQQGMVAVNGGNGSAVMNLPTGATTSRSLADRAGDFLRPSDFLKSSAQVLQLTAGQIDAEPAFAAAIAGGRRTVLVPCGTYRFDEPLPVTASFTRISGYQYGCVIINQNFTTGSAFSVSGAASATGIEGVTIDHIKVQMASGVTKTRGASFHADSAHNVHFENDRSDGDYIAFDLRSGANQFDYFAINNEVNGAQYAAFLLSDNGNAAIQVEDVYLVNNAIGHSGAGYLIQNASGVFGLHSDICCSSGKGVVVAPNANQNVNALYLTKFLGDQTTQVDGAFSFPNSGGFVTEVRLTDCWGASNTAGPGLSVANPKLNGMVIEGFQAHANYLSGIDIEAGSNILIHAAQVFYNSTMGNSALPGVLIQGTASHVTLSDSIMGSGGLISQNGSGKSNYQNYGFLVAGNAAYIIAHDNQTFGNASGGYNDSSAGATNKTNNIHDNLEGSKDH